MDIQTRWTLVTIAISFLLVEKTRSQSFLQLKYFVLKDGNWEGERRYLCDENTGPLPQSPHLLIDIPQPFGNHETCTCVVTTTTTTGSSNVQARIKIPSNQNSHEHMYLSSDWIDGQQVRIVMERVQEHQNQNKTHLQLFLQESQPIYDTPIRIEVLGDFSMECGQITTSPTTSFQTTPANVETKDSFKTMQGFLAAILSAVAVTLTTIAVIILCCYKRQKKKQSNSAVIYKLPPTQPFSQNSHSDIYRPQNHYSHDNGFAEVIYDNNINNDNSNQSKRKSLSFRDTMYANFTAILASVGRSQFNSKDNTKHRQLQNQFSVEPRAFVNASPQNIDSNSERNSTVQYADIDVNKLAPVVSDRNTEYNISYADLDFQTQIADRSNDPYDNAISLGLTI